jgi:hypothetical protein
VIHINLLKRDNYKIGKIIISIEPDKININSKISISKKLLKRIIIVKYAVQTLLKIIIILLILK